MDTFDSFWEMDSDKNLTENLTDPDAWHRSDDNSSTFLLRKVELKIRSDSVHFNKYWDVGFKYTNILRIKNLDFTQ